MMTEGGQKIEAAEFLFGYVKWFLFFWIKYDSRLVSSFIKYTGVVVCRM